MILLFQFFLILTVTLLWYQRLVLRPEIRETTRKLNWPGFQRTIHQEAIRYALGRLRARDRFLSKIVPGSVLVTVGLASLLFRR